MNNEVIFWIHLFICFYLYIYFFYRLLSVFIFLCIYSWVSLFTSSIIHLYTWICFSIYESVCTYVRLYVISLVCVNVVPANVRLPTAPKTYGAQWYFRIFILEFKPRDGRSDTRKARVARPTAKDNKQAMSGVITKAMQLMTQGWRGTNTQELQRWWCETHCCVIGHRAQGPIHGTRHRVYGTRQEKHGMTYKLSDAPLKQILRVSGHKACVFGYSILDTEF